MIQWLIKYKIITMETVSTSGLYTNVVKLLNKLAAILSVLVKKDTGSGLLPVVQELEKLFNWTDEGSEVGGAMSSICRAATPARLIDVLVDIAVDKVGIISLK